MNYYTSAEVAKIWNISQRRVQVYCKEGRIRGAVLMGNRWLVPKMLKNQMILDEQIRIVHKCLFMIDMNTIVIRGIEEW